MSAFTEEQKEQMARLDEMARTVFSVARWDLEKVRKLETYVLAMMRVLISKGVTSTEEIDEEVKFVEAEHAVEITLSPEAAALQEQYDRLIEETERKSPAGEEGKKEDRDG